MKESHKNIVFTCPTHSSKPDPSLQTLPPLEYIGKYVKISFLEEGSTRRTEHMWVEITGVESDNKTLVGILDNDPVLDVGYKCGDTVKVRINQIEVIYTASRRTGSR